MLLFRVGEAYGLDDRGVEVSDLRWDLPNLLSNGYRELYSRR
jgi:hypothetical protein